MGNNSFQIPNLSPRLAAAASWVRKGSIVADIGTDHAYLPIWLVLTGICPSAIACDVVSGPILRAKSNINKYQLSDRITTLQTSGLEGIEPYAPDDILLCGMGGELIASLLEKSDYSKNNSVRLILQPMTMSDRLRIWLTKNGFSILDEHLVAEHNGSKVYQLLYVTYTGIVAELTPLQALIGPCNLEKREPLFEVHVQKCREGLCKKQRGMQQADLDSHLLLELIHQLDCL